MTPTSSRAPAAASLLGLVGLNNAFYTLLLCRCGPRRAAAGVVLHAAHHLTALVALPAGLAVQLLERRRDGRRAARR
jgi:hypothetical protein